MRRARTFSLAAAMAGMALGLATPASAETRVIKGSGGAEKRYQRKAVLQETMVIKLKKGEKLKLLRNGRTVTFTGPANGTVLALSRNRVVTGENASATTRGATTRGIRVRPATVTASPARPPKVADDNSSMAAEAAESSQPE